MPTSYGEALLWSESLKDLAMNGIDVLFIVLAIGVAMPILRWALRKGV